MTKNTIARRNYYVAYYKGARNTYHLLYAETPADYAALPSNAERITRREALHLAATEAQRRRDDPAFGGCADAYIYPAADDDVDWRNDRRYQLISRIWDRVQK